MLCAHLRWSSECGGDWPGGTAFGAAERVSLKIAGADCGNTPPLALLHKLMVSIDHLWCFEFVTVTKVRDP